ncbi:unnamed protein product [Adineta ricciae]|uniref:G-protein coupled receptors family 1 profile domain-containing protein n=1 Tax=Adineta ricciae TaxID=249248 RepID=A0A813UZH1_ADIRI|nr:unnamed protein product [Adineta ricciae]CAF1137314.1 unnamed protein product [Adineta ricciae]
MFSTDNITYLNYISTQLNIYAGIFFYVFGVWSNIFCIIMFRTVKKLKRNPSSIYIFAASLCSLVLLNTSLLSRSILPGFKFDPSSRFFVWCKLRQYLGQVSALTALFCVVWAMMDQYLSTSSRICLRHLSTIKNARRLVLLTFVVWFLHGLPLVINNQISVLAPNNVTTCSLSRDLSFQTYTAYVVTPFFLGIIPSFLMVVFAILVYANVNYLHQEQMRTRIQRQLTRMITSQIVLILIGTSAYTTLIIYTLLTVSIPKAPMRQAQENIGLTLALLLSYTGYSFHFYIYMFVSSSFRKHFKEFIKKFLRYLSHYYRAINITKLHAQGPRNSMQRYTT